MARLHHGGYQDGAGSVTGYSHFYSGDVERTASGVFPFRPMPDGGTKLSQIRERNLVSQMTANRIPVRTFGAAALVILSLAASGLSENTRSTRLANIQIDNFGRIND